MNKSYDDSVEKSSGFTPGADDVLKLLNIFNPSGQCLAAEHWVSKKKVDSKGKPLSGFAPIFANKGKAGCQLGKIHSTCDGCPQKKPVFVDAENIQVRGRTLMPICGK